MIQKYNKKHLIETIEFLKKYNNSDLYITENNQRIFINNIDSLKRIEKKSSEFYVCEDDKGTISGLLILWKSLGNNIERYFVKIASKDEKTAKNLITMLLWNFDNKTLFTKIKKDSEYLPVFQSKGFFFIGDRGREILLKRKADMYIKGDKRDDFSKE